MAHYISNAIANASKEINTAKANLNKIDTALYSVANVREWNKLKSAELDNLLAARRAVESLLSSLNIQIELHTI